MGTKDNLYPDAKSKTSLEDGLEFQDFVCEQLYKNGIVVQYYASRKWQYSVGESVQGIEIKLDNRCTGDDGSTPTGRLSIETEEKSKSSNSEFVPSGIYRKDNTWLYVQGNRTVIFVFAKSTLVILHQKKNKDGTPYYKTNNYVPTIRAFFLPLQDAEKYAAKVIQVDSEAYTKIKQALNNSAP